MRDDKVARRIVELCDGLDDGNPDQRDVKKYLTQFLLIKARGICENEIDQIICKGQADRATTRLSCLFRTQCPPTNTWD